MIPVMPFDRLSTLNCFFAVLYLCVVLHAQCQEVMNQPEADAYCAQVPHSVRVGHRCYAIEPVTYSGPVGNGSVFACASKPDGRLAHWSGIQRIMAAYATIPWPNPAVHKWLYAAYYQYDSSNEPEGWFIAEGNGITDRNVPIPKDALCWQPGQPENANYFTATSEAIHIKSFVERVQAAAGEPNNDNGPFPGPVDSSADSYLVDGIGLVDASTTFAGFTPQYHTCEYNIPNAKPQFLFAKTDIELTDYMLYAEKIVKQQMSCANSCIAAVRGVCRSFSYHQMIGQCRMYYVDSQHQNFATYSVAAAVAGTQLFDMV